MAVKANVSGQTTRDLAQAYWHAARSTRGALAEREYDCDADIDFFPTAFLYRHAIELWIKGLLHNGLYNESAKKDSSNRRKKSPHMKIIDKGHHLEAQIPALKDFYFSVVEGRQAEWDQIESMIRSWSKLDPTGMGFRYGLSKESNKHGDPTPMETIAHADSNLRAKVKEWEAGLELLKALNDRHARASELDHARELEEILKDSDNREAQRGT